MLLPSHLFLSFVAFWLLVFGSEIPFVAVAIPGPWGVKWCFLSSYFPSKFSSTFFVSPSQSTPPSLFWLVCLCLIGFRSVLVTKVFVQLKVFLYLLSANQGPKDKKRIICSFFLERKICIVFYPTHVCFVFGFLPSHGRKILYIILDLATWVSFRRLLLDQSISGLNLSFSIVDAQFVDLLTRSHPSKHSFSIEIPILVGYLFLPSSPSSDGCGPKIPAMASTPTHNHSRPLAQ